LMLIAMTIWETKSPTVMRKGFLPIATTRGDRLFMGLLAAAYINLAFIGLAGKFAEWFSMENEPSIWISFVLSMAVLALIMRRG
jgi:predicted small integral membrane protein